MISLRLKGGVELGFLNVFLFCERDLIDKLYLERYLTITLMIIEDQKLNIYENKLMISGGAEQGFLNVFLFCEKYLIDKFDLERYLTITLMIINIYLISSNKNLYLKTNIIWICKYVGLNMWIVWISYTRTYEKYLIDKYDLEGCLIIILRTLEELKLNMYWRIQKEMGSLNDDNILKSKYVKNFNLILT